MAYQVGIDLGTTFTGAALHRDGRVEVVSLGSRVTAIPSVVLLRDDETVLTGEAAVRRAFSEPDRVAREFKRRLGDTTPIMVGGSPYSAEALMARLLRSVVDEVTTREGQPPSAIAVSHPANWGAYKIDLLHQAVRLADLDTDQVTFVTEPEAAATFYAHQERVEPGEVVAVYDLGGGTFDAAILRATAERFEIIGRPEGIERLGGIDFDAAVFSHVVRSLGGLVEELDPDDPAVQAAVARLRQECVDAKEALSSDTDAVISVLLPNAQTEVRITRAEFEGLIRPSLADSITAMRRAMRSAGVEAEDVSRVLLVGGSSRIPLIAQLVSAELGRPVAVDAHPKHAVSMGAAYLAGRAATSASPATAAIPADQLPTAQAPVMAMPAAAATTLDPTPGEERSRTPLLIGVGALAVVALVVLGIVLFGGGDDETDSAGDGPGSGAVVVQTTAVTLPTTEPADTGPGATEPPTTDAEDPTTTTAAGRDPAAIEADVVAALEALDLRPGRAELEVAVAADVVTLSGLLDDDEVRADLVGAAVGVEGVASVTDGMTLRSEDERCTSDIQSLTRWVCIASVTFDGTEVRAEYVSDFSGETPAVDGGFHYHLFGDQIDVDQGGVPGSGPWLVWQDPEYVGAPDPIWGTAEVSTKLCMRIANAGHEIDETSGNCRPIELIGDAAGAPSGLRAPIVLVPADG